MEANAEAIAHAQHADEEMEANAEAIAHAQPDAQRLMEVDAEANAEANAKVEAEAEEGAKEHEARQLAAQVARAAAEMGGLAEAPGLAEMQREGALAVASAVESGDTVMAEMQQQHGAEVAALEQELRGAASGGRRPGTAGKWPLAEQQRGRERAPRAPRQGRGRWDRAEARAVLEAPPRPHRDEEQKRLEIRRYPTPQLDLREFCILRREFALIRARPQDKIQPAQSSSCGV